MTLDARQLTELLDTAAGILDGASTQFVAGHRADSAVAKKGDDFATEVDLAIERRVVAELQRLTGIGVHGEEFGGEAVDSELVWILDPIDGTFNYAAGSPMAAILLALVADGEPVLGLTWLPFMAQSYTAMAGGPVRCNGDALAPLQRGAVGDAIAGDIVVLAVPVTAFDELVAAYGAQLDRKIVVDVTNPVDFATFDSLTVPSDSSAAAELQAKLPGAKVVKAFNTVFAGVLAAGQVGGDTPATVLVAGDDDAAKAALI